MKRRIKAIGKISRRLRLEIEFSIQVNPDIRFIPHEDKVLPGPARNLRFFQRRQRRILHRRERN